MTQPNENAIVTLSPLFRFQWEEAQQCYVILYPEGMVKLNPSAGEIMNQVNGEASIATICNTLSKKFDGADVKDDVTAFFVEAEDNGWVNFG